VTVDSVWTLAMHVRLRELTAEGEVLSYDTIADKLNVEFDMKFTRNAVIGKARRLGIKKKPAPSFATAVREPGYVPRRERVKPQKINKVARFPITLSGLAPAGPRDGRKTILELNRLSCRWAFGERVPYLFCGQRTDGSSYCPEHSKLVYGRLKSAR